MLKLDILTLPPHFYSTHVRVAELLFNSLNAYIGNRREGESSTHGAGTGAGFLFFSLRCVISFYFYFSQKILLSAYHLLFCSMFMHCMHYVKKTFAHFITTTPLILSGCFLRVFENSNKKMLAPHALDIP